MAWMLHHVNLPALEVRETRAFLRDLIGLREGRWIYPETQGELHHDEDSIAYFGIENRGLHVVRSVVSFARDNGFMHNPTIGGHFAISVKDLDAVKRRLDAAKIPFSDAGVYAMAGIHQVYCFDPAFNMIEVNQTVTPLPSTALTDQDQAADIHLRHAAIPAHDLDASAAFFRDVIGLGKPAVDTKSAIFRSGDHAVRLTHATSAFTNGRSTDPALRDPYFTLAVSDLDSVKDKLDRASIPNSGLMDDPIDDGAAIFTYAPSMRLMAIVQH